MCPWRAPGRTKNGLPSHTGIAVQSEPQVGDPRAACTWLPARKRRSCEQTKSGTVDYSGSYCPPRGRGVIDRLLPFKHRTRGKRTTVPKCMPSLTRLLLLVIGTPCSGVGRGPAAPAWDSPSLRSTCEAPLVRIAAMGPRPTIASHTGVSSTTVARPAFRPVLRGGPTRGGGYRLLSFRG